MVQAVILAGGEGHRQRPLTKSMPKVMLPVANRPIIGYVVESLLKNGIRDIIVVAGYRSEQLIRYLNTLDEEVKVVIQKKQTGAADALRCAKDLITGDFLLLPGDNYIDEESISRIKTEKNAMLVSEHPQPSNYGVVEISNGYLAEIVEKPEITENVLVSTGIFSLTKDFFDYPVQCSIPDVIELMTKKGISIRAIPACRWHDAIYPWDLIRMNRITLKRIAKESSGKISRQAVISGRVNIGKGTEISPGAIITGPVVLGEDCYIGPNSVIMPYTSIGSRVRVEPFTYIEDSVVMDDVTVGSHSRITESVIGDGCMLSDHTVTVCGRFVSESEEERNSFVYGDFGCVIGERTTSAPFTVFKNCIVGHTSSIEKGRVIEGRLPDNSIVR
ncbi:NTP transferase domain-containing protein [Methanoplanus sp. FWC-SCC4]|uniref:Bifunctional protein GlmU n=1 Tax=Methanochimaera problematica TaxID=2609417 RepID=A0AA97FCM3_9EURY|nr:sugar phosphate nucleotidyltransferase [Methanoplanus sp. FWC-SCC4]WOF16597.1 NTP transferase domain-containing protein [Methanoplanus sp. FWC-SCC4]